MKRTLFSDFKPEVQGFIFLILFFLGLILTVFSTTIVLKIFPLGSRSLTEAPFIISPGTIIEIRLSAFLQNLFAFFSPTVIWFYLCRQKSDLGLFNRKNLTPLLFIGIGLLWVMLNPFITWTGIINEKMALPHAFSRIEESLKRYEKQIDEIIQEMLKAKGFSSIILNLITMALIPALGEEFFFRGGIQKILQKIMRKDHLAIILGAVIFSTIHFQFYGFFPRLILGLILGYLYYWSGSLWPGVFFHFINNGIQIVLAGISEERGSKGVPSWLENPNAGLAVFSFFLSSLLIIWIYKLILKQRNGLEYGRLG